MRGVVKILVARGVLRMLRSIIYAHVTQLFGAGVLRADLIIKNCCG